jgi:2-polyprenyl-6-methoxyphenol hydroxylase-like FAD-dependent oxidoreductase
MDTKVVIVGGGHNGLTAACYLAKAGIKVDAAILAKAVEDQKKRDSR